MTRPLRVAVLVDLELGPRAGGHVKTWERFGQAASRVPDELDLTLFFSGGGRKEEILAPNLRYRFHGPILSTARLPFLSHVPAHADLAPFHPSLARGLKGFDVLHTTDGFFAFARTAAWVARRRGIPLVNSVHTDTPGYSRIYAAQTIRRLVGRGRLEHLLVQRLRLPELSEARALASLVRHQRRAAFVLGSGPDDMALAERVLPRDRIGFLGRGIDKDFFHPRHRDRAAIMAESGIPPDRLLVFFAGRLSRGKNVHLLAEAIHVLARQGLDIHLLCAGEGPEKPDIEALLGDRVTCPGFCGPDVLPRLYASADLFVLPSESETWGNVAVEAAASGIPAIVMAASGARQLVRHGTTGLVVDRADVAVLADAIALLAGDPGRRTAMGRAARELAEREMPSWDQVLARDLLPVWHRVARRV